MVVPHMSADEFIKYLVSQGVKIESDGFFDETGRLIMSKDGRPFAFQVAETYYYPFIVRTCFDLQIAPPEQHLRNYMQYVNYLSRKKRSRVEEEE